MGYHLVNVLLHAGNAVLVWLILRRLSIPRRYLAALILRAASGARRVSGLDNRTQECPFGLLLLECAASLLARLVCRTDCDDGSSRLAVVRGDGAVVRSRPVEQDGNLFAAGRHVDYPMVEIWPHHARDLAITAPLFVLGLASGLATVYLEKHHVGAQGEEWNFSPVDRLLIAGRAVWFYAAKLVWPWPWPWPLAFIYPRWTIDAKVWWQYLYPLGAVGLLVAAWLFAPPDRSWAVGRAVIFWRHARSGAGLF